MKAQIDRMPVQRSSQPRTKRQYVQATHRRTVGVVFALGLIGGIAWAVWATAYDRAVDRIAERTEADLTLAADRLTRELQHFAEHAVLISDRPELRALAESTEPSRREVLANALLLEISDKIRARNVVVVSTTGQVLAAAHPVAPDAPDFKGRADFERAMTGALGLVHMFAAEPPARISSYAHPIFGTAGRVVGAVAVEINVETIEADWRADPTPVFFSTRSGRVLVSNRVELFEFNPNPPAEGSTEAPRPAVFVTRETRLGPHEIWGLDAGRYLPSQAVHITRSLPLIDMRGEALADLAPARRAAWLQALAAGALATALGLAVLVAAERRRMLQSRLTVQSALKAELEVKVTERTHQLQSANTSLRHEVNERKEAEAALRAAQENLVQAGKLSALGKMSAGISHELNQPLMAIQSFAENAKVLQDRGKEDAVSENLGHISDLARRMGRIISNLRAFARQERIPIGDVDLISVVDAALELAAPRIRQDDVTLEWAPPETPVVVRAGAVRLQQVVLNLVTNALDAVVGSDRRILSLSVETTGDAAILRVADSGPGIQEPEKIFDPFYSTKEVGQSEGMGLGLSISYGLAQSFGGDIRGRNRPEGGAEFAVTLRAVSNEAAA